MTGKQLKNTILQEAIEGRLVPQDPNDEPASVLLERIREEKKRLVKEGKLKKKDLEETPIREDEKPFEIPDSWEWVRWGMLGDYKKGPFGSSLTKSMFVPKSIEAIKVYEQKNAIQKDSSLGNYYISKDKYKEMVGFTVQPGEIIVSCAGTIGETYLLPDDAPIGIINQALMRARLHDKSIIPYWMLYFRYILIIENKLKGSGSAIKNIPPFEELKSMLVALPPLNEQKRILSKYEELISKVEEYGKAQDALDKLNAELPERLKKSILQEAISGRLVPQDPNDEPASILLDKIRAEKAKLVKEGKLKKKDLEETPIQEDEIPFDIPDSWEWCRVFDCVDILYGYPFDSTAFNETGIGFPLIRIRDIIPSFTKTYTTERADERYIIKKGDMLVGMDGNFNVRFWQSDDAYLNQRVCKIRTKEDVLSQKFLYYYLPYALEDIFGSVSFVTVKHLSDKHFRSMFIPLPPLAEQKRIVAKIEQLLGEIDKLK